MSASTDPVLPNSIASHIRDLERRIRELELRRSPALADAIADIDALETDLGALQPTAWTGVTFENGWYNYSAGFVNVQYRKEGDLVRLRGLARKDATGSAGETVCTLPAGFRPPGAIIVPAVASIGGGAPLVVRLDVSVTGLVTTSAAPARTTGNWISLEFAFSTI